MNENIAHPARGFCLDDEAFVRGETPMTKEDIRTLVIRRLCIPLDGVVYDIGAGTGSVSIAAAMVAARGEVYAVEKDAAAINVIRRNADRLGVRNVITVHAVAPAGLDTLPDADCVFIGGSGDETDALLPAVASRLKEGGRLVLTCITVETLYSALRFLEELFTNTGGECVAISHMRRAGNKHMFLAQNPVYIVWGDKM